MRLHCKRSVVDACTKSVSHFCALTRHLLGTFSELAVHGLPAEAMKGFMIKRPNEQCYNIFGVTTSEPVFVSQESTNESHVLEPLDKIFTPHFPEDICLEASA